MDNVFLFFLKALLVPLRYFVDPFGFLYKIKRPQTRGRAGKPPLNFQNVQVTDPNRRIEFLIESVQEKNRMHNEVVTNLRTLAITIFVAMGAFLGVILGVIATSDVRASWTFSASAWVLLVCFIVGTLATLLEWSYERNRVRQVQMYEEIGTLLLIEGDEVQAKEFLGKTIDDLEHRPAMEILAGAILPALRNLSLILSYIALIVMAVGILWNAGSNEGGTKQQREHFDGRYRHYWMRGDLFR